MGSFLISLIIGAGVGAFAYSKLGRRVGYGNSGNVWVMVAATALLSFLIVFILLKTLVSL